MLYDRPYMRQSPPPATKNVSIVTGLIIFMVGVFILQNVLNVAFPGVGGRPNQFLLDWFALSGEHFRELKVWTVFSYSALHSTQNLMHIVGNMLGLYFLGRALEELLGKRQFIFLCLGSAFVGAAVYLSLHYGDDPIAYLRGEPVYQNLIGASGIVFGIVSLYCLIRPEQPITLLLFFVLPVTIKPKWVFWGALGISAFATIFYELPGHSNVAHSAHLGGMLAGILFYRLIYQRGIQFATPPARPSVELPEWFKRKSKAAPKMSYRVNRSSPRRENLQEEVDRILDKINESGFGSLNDEEKQTLEKAKDLLSR